MPTLTKSAPGLRLAVDLATFRESFSVVAEASLKTSTKSALESVLITVDETGAVMEATDREVSIRATLADVRSLTPMQFLAPGRKVDQILRSISKSTGEVGFTVDGPKLRIDHGRGGYWDLQTADPATYPGLQIPDATDQPIELMGSHLAKALDRTAYAVNVTGNQGNWALGGVQFDWEDRWLILRAADGRRVAFQRVPAATPDECPKLPRAVPGRLAGIIRDQAASFDSAVVSFPADSSIRVDMGNIVIWGTMLEGRFPNLSKFFEVKESHQPVEINRADLLSAIQRISVVADGTTEGVDFAFEGSTLTLQAPGNEKGSGEQPVDLAAPCTPTVVRLNPQYLVDALTRIDADTITLNVGGSRDIVMFEHDNLNYCTMPIGRE